MFRSVSWCLEKPELILVFDSCVNVSDQPDPPVLQDLQEPSHRSSGTFHPFHSWYCDPFGSLWPHVELSPAKVYVYLCFHKYSTYIYIYYCNYNQLYIYVCVYIDIEICIYIYIYHPEFTYIIVVLLSTPRNWWFKKCKLGTNPSPSSGHLEGQEEGCCLGPNNTTQTCKRNQHKWEVCVVWKMWNLLMKLLL